MLGTRTVFTTGVGVVVGIFAAYRGHFDLSRLSHIDAGVMFWIGAFAVLAATFALQLIQPIGRSKFALSYSSSSRLSPDETHFLGSTRHHIVLGINRGEAFDYSPRIHWMVFFVTAFVMGVETLDQQAIALLREFPGAAAFSDSEFCPPDLDLTLDASNSTMPGCALVQRAFELGWVKDLGRCAPQQSTKEAAACDRRQYDEPLLHYNWRRFQAMLRSAKAYWGEAYFRTAWDVFKEKSEVLDDFYTLQQDVIASEPRASHHIWTNLPNPYANDLRTRFTRYVGVQRCEDNFRNISGQPNIPTSNPYYASLYFEKIIAQLLFDPQYVPAAANCREWKIHWDAGADICARLSQAPMAVLEQSGALESIQRLMARHQREKRIRNIRIHEISAMSALHVDEPDYAQRKAHLLTDEKPLNELIGLHCYVEAAGMSRVHAEAEVVVEEHALSIHTLQMPIMSQGIPVDHFHAIGVMLAPKFSYTHFSDSSEVVVGRFSPTKGVNYLAELEKLEATNIFLNRRALGDNKDLFEIYPYHIHLRNFVSLFRRKYTEHRSRL